MLGNLIIKNIGPLKNIEIDAKKILVLIGPQSTGKSIIAKLFSIFKSYGFLEQVVSFEDAIKNHNISSFFNDESFIEYSNDKVAFTYSNKTPILKFFGSSNFKDVAERIAGAGTLFDQMNVLQTKREELMSVIQTRVDKYKVMEASVKNGELSDLDEEYVESKKAVESNFAEVEKISTELDTFISSIRDSLEKFKEFSPFSFYIPAERNLLSILSSAVFSITKNEINLPKNLVEFASHFERARNGVSDLDLEFLPNFSYRRINEEDFIYIKDVDKLIHLSSSSSGFQTIIPLLLVLEFTSKTFVKTEAKMTYVIEEPELNLFPETQYALLKHLNKKYLQGISNDIVITTHSPYTLSGFNNLLLNYKLKEMTGTDENDLGWVDSNSFGAYYVNNGSSVNIVDEKTRMISDNELDSASEYILNDYEFLMTQLKRNLDAKSN